MLDTYMRVCNQYLYTYLVFFTLCNFMIPKISTNIRLLNYKCFIKVRHSTYRWGRFNGIIRELLSMYSINSCSNYSADYRGSFVLDSFNCRLQLPQSHKWLARSLSIYDSCTVLSYYTLHLLHARTILRSFYVQSTLGWCCSVLGQSMFR